MIRPQAPDRVAPGVQSDRALSGLRELVMNGRFTPGERLVESRLCAELEVSRTPLREALIRLHADGLLERHAGGYHPVHYDLPTLRDLYELRVVLELHGLQRAVDNPEVELDHRMLFDLRGQWEILRSAPPARARTSSRSTRRST